MEVPSLLAPVDDVLLGSLEADRKTNRSTALERAGREATEIERRRWLSSLLRPSAILPSSRHRETARLLLLLRLRGGSRRLGAFLEPFRSQTVAITSCATMYRRAVRFTRGHDAHVKVVQAAMISCAARPHPSLSSPSSSPPPPPSRLSLSSLVTSHTFFASVHSGHRQSISRRHLFSFSRRGAKNLKNHRRACFTPCDGV